MSPGALLILFQKSFMQFAGTLLFFIVIILFDTRGFSSKGLMKIAIILGLSIGVPLLIAFLNYYFRKFHIEGDKLIFTHGFTFKQTTSIPLERVHTLRTKRGVLYQLLNLRGVVFDTLASKEQEVELILNEQDWQQLLQRVRMGEDFAEIKDESVTLPPPVEDNTVDVSNRDIIKGALCQNHLKGFALLGAALVWILDKISEFRKDTYDRIVDYVDGQAADVLPSIGACILLAAIVYVIVMLLWTGSVFLRYSGMWLRFADNRLTMESGLLARYTNRVARDKATVLMIKQNPLEKLAGCQTITLRQADNVSGDKNEGNIRIYGTNLGGRLLNWWLGERRGVFDQPLVSARSGRGLFMRKFIPQLFVAIAVAVIMSYALESWIPAVIVAALYIAVMGLRAAMAWKHGGIVLNESYLQIDRGNIACIHEYIKYPDIESVSIRRTPFTSVSGRVSISISTNAGLSTVYALKIDTARRIRNQILNARNYL